jgi:toxin ParE1/3/4
MRRDSYRISNKANQDLDEIWNYTLKNWSAEQANRYYNLIIDEIKYLSKNIQNGKPIDHVRVGYRVSKVKSHLIFYRESQEFNIEITRILHERMDFENRLKD